MSNEGMPTGSPNPQESQPKLSPEEQFQVLLNSAADSKDKDVLKEAFNAAKEKRFDVIPRLTHPGVHPDLIAKINEAVRMGEELRRKYEPQRAGIIGSAKKVGEAEKIGEQWHFGEEFREKAEEEMKDDLAKRPKFLSGEEIATMQVELEGLKKKKDKTPEDKARMKELKETLKPQRTEALLRKIQDKADDLEPTIFFMEGQGIDQTKEKKKLAGLERRAGEISEKTGIKVESEKNAFKVLRNLLELSMETVGKYAKVGTGEMRQRLFDTFKKIWEGKREGFDLEEFLDRAIDELSENMFKGVEEIRKNPERRKAMKRELLDALKEDDKDTRHRKFDEWCDKYLLEGEIRDKIKSGGKELTDLKKIRDLLGKKMTAKDREELAKKAGEVKKDVMGAWEKAGVTLGFVVMALMLAAFIALIIDLAIMEKMMNIKPPKK